MDSTTPYLEPKLISFEFSLLKWDWAVSCVGNVWKLLSDVRSHILTSVVTARVSANNRNHNANHSTEVAWDASGWMTELNALRSDCSLMDTERFSELFIHFKAFWACLVVIDTTDKAHGTHCRAWRSPGRRTQERERSKSAGSSSVEVQGPRSRCQVLPEEVQKLDFLAFLSVFKPKVPREVLSRTLRFFLSPRLVMSAGGTRGFGSERILSSRRFWSFFCWELFQVDEKLTGVLWQSSSSCKSA